MDRASTARINQMTAPMHATTSPRAVTLSLKKTQFFTKADFTQLFNNAKRKQGRFFILHYLQDSEIAQPSLGTVISKKNTQTSVRRNLVKRLAREHFRLAQHELSHLKVMLVSKREISKATREELNQDLEQLFNTLKKLQKSMENAKL